jgi:hypothetical protein
MVESRTIFKGAPPRRYLQDAFRSPTRIPSAALTAPRLASGTGGAACRLGALWGPDALAKTRP